MARPIKAGVDYFQHDTDSMGKKTLFTLESRFGNDGYAFWFKLLEILGTQDGFYYDCGNPADWLYLVAKTRVDEVTATEILNTLSQIGAIDTELWDCKIIWIQKFVDRLKVLFDKRVSEIPKKPSIRSGNPTISHISEAETPHRIEENSIEQDITPHNPPRGDAEINNENEQDESLTVETAKGTGSEKPVDHSMTPVKKRFEEFWDGYPKKVGKGAAERAWAKIKPSEELLQKMLKAIEIQKQSFDWTKEGGQFIPYPATWLNGKRWEDEYETQTQFNSMSSFDEDEFFEKAVKRSLSGV